jgi:hypothetical protein
VLNAHCGLRSFCGVSFQVRNGPVETLVVGIVHHSSEDAPRFGENRPMNDVYGKLDQKNVTAWLDLRNKRPAVTIQSTRTSKSRCFSAVCGISLVRIPV